MYLVKVYVTFANSVVNPAAEATKAAAQNMGYKDVQDVRIGKFIELQIDKSDNSDTPVEETVEALCKSLLTNPNTEDYSYEIQEVAAL